MGGWVAGWLGGWVAGCRAAGSEVLEGLSPGQAAQSLAARLDEGPDPLGVDPRVLAQRPPDRLADEELLPELRALQVRVDDVGQQVEVGLLAVLQLREDGGSAHPEVAVNGI